MFNLDTLQPPEPKKPFILVVSIAFSLIFFAVTASLIVLGIAWMIILGSIPSMPTVAEMLLILRTDLAFSGVITLYKVLMYYADS